MPNEDTNTAEAKTAIPNIAEHRYTHQESQENIDHMTFTTKHRVLVQLQQPVLAIYVQARKAIWHSRRVANASPAKGYASSIKCLVSPLYVQALFAVFCKTHVGKNISVQQPGVGVKRFPAVSSKTRWTADNKNDMLAPDDCHLQVYIATPTLWQILLA